jgi:hypothetical protein
VRTSSPAAGRRAVPRPAAPTFRRLILVAAFAAAAVAGCGDGDGTSDGDAEAVGEVRVGTVAPLAQCRDWLGADADERIATIEDIRRQVNTGDLEHENAELTDEQAADVFDGACENDFAAGFRLYKLYYRAAAFQPLLDPLDG